MAITACTISAERWLDEVVLLGSIDNTAGAPIVESFSLPAGLGDVAILNLIASVVNVATVPGAATANRGVMAHILNSDATSRVDTVGVSEWFATGGSLAAFDRFDAYIDPDALVLWRQAELLTIVSPEMDVNAAPTADLRILIKCVRVRPIESPIGPIQLVR